ncbi:unnamed protein product, partial [marine sediment metagenome]
REELKPAATKRVTRSLVLEKIAEAEKIEVSDAEIDTEIENMTRGAITRLGARQGLPTLNELTKRYQELYSEQL